MDRTTLLFHHTHTPDSNRYEQEIRGVKIKSHATSYLEIVNRLPENCNAIFIKTDHWKTSPEYFDRIEDELHSKNTGLTRFESHVYFELDGTRAAIINGVEAAVESQNNHITICGLPLENERTYETLQFTDLENVARDAAWIAPAHIGMPFHHVPTDLMESICGLSSDSSIEVALGYTTGYFPMYNRISRNEIPFRTSVGEYADRFDLNVLPELDIHAVVPDGFAGCGLVETAAIDALRNGDIPVEEIFDSDLFTPGGYQRGIRVDQFLRNYATFIPLYGNGNVSFEELFETSLPSTDWLESVDFEKSSVPLR